MNVYMVSHCRLIHDSKCGLVSHFLRQWQQRETSPYSIEQTKRPIGGMLQMIDPSIDPSIHPSVCPAIRPCIHKIPKSKKVSYKFDKQRLIQKKQPEKWYKWSIHSSNHPSNRSQCKNSKWHQEGKKQTNSGFALDFYPELTLVLAALSAFPTLSHSPNLPLFFFFIFLI